MTWTGESYIEPPRHVLSVRDSGGFIADRTTEECAECHRGSVWRWRHNGGAECWLDIDGIGPWVEVAGVDAT